ncbi:hypothetical protein [Leptospira sp. GIMC2001]|uniref:hypothetical protein n=1 Tax=Leptospira sp. GIMC2001 TaxID=1513297 RepID=UPI00234ABE21|nr:hypothetical protein [Leptospira sp. GIMC2001]WCL49974.1 hypothetical protein O4O04_03915 [Leptospira sp. GIMC2001]
MTTKNGSSILVKIQEGHLSFQDDVFHEIDELIEKMEPESFELDLRDIHRLNSNAIGRLVYIKRYITDEKGLKFNIHNINPQILKTLKSVKVDGVLGIGDQA